MTQQELDEIDGLSDREIARQTYVKVCEVENSVKALRKRVNANEDITEPIRKITDSTKQKLIYLLGWGVLGLIAWVVYLVLKTFKGIKF